MSNELPNKLFEDAIDFNFRKFSHPNKTCLYLQRVYRGVAYSMKHDV